MTHTHPDNPELEWVTNTGEPNWRDWFCRPDAQEGPPMPTRTCSAGEVASWGIVGIYAPPVAEGEHKWPIA